MILILPLWTFHVYVETYQQHLHIDHLSLSWYDIPELVVLIRVPLSQLIRYSRACGSYRGSLDRGVLLTRKLLHQGFLLVKLKSSHRKYYGRHHDLVDCYGISVSQMTTDMFPLVVNTSKSFTHSWLITGFVTRLIRRLTLMEQELLSLPKHMSSPPVFSGVRVTRSLVLCVCFLDRCLSFCIFSFGHCVFCCSSIYGFFGYPFKLFLWVAVQHNQFWFLFSK